MVFLREEKRMNSYQDKTDTNYDLPKANIQRIIKTAIPEGKNF